MSRTDWADYNEEAEERDDAFFGWWMAGTLAGILLMVLGLGIWVFAQ